MKNSSSVFTFKWYISGVRQKTNKYYNACTGKKRIWITRLRLGLSPLNSHRFKYNLVSEHFCSFCPNTLETIEHLFFDCPLYATPCIPLLQSFLADIGVNTNDRTETINEILYGISFRQTLEKIFDPTIIFLSVTNRFKWFRIYELYLINFIWIYSQILSKFYNIVFSYYHCTSH